MARFIAGIGGWAALAAAGAFSPAGCALAADGPATTRPAETTSAALTYQKPVRLADMADERIDESSGLAAGRRNPDLLWTHNDSGDGPRLYAVTPAGKTVGAYTLRGVKARDWEDLASFKLDGNSYLLAADVGDNAFKRRRVVLYLAAEPAIDANAPAEAELDVLARIPFTLEGGPRDCESVAVDVPNRQIVLLSKERIASLRASTVYQLPLQLTTPAEPLVARKVGRCELSFPTGLDISPDGLRAVAVTYGNGRVYGRESTDQPWGEVLKREGAVLAMPHLKQGEAVAFGPDGRAIYLTSEKRPAPLYVLRPQAAATKPAETPAPK